MMVSLLLNEHSFNLTNATFAFVWHFSLFFLANFSFEFLQSSYVKISRFEYFFPVWCIVSLAYVKQKWHLIAKYVRKVNFSAEKWAIECERINEWFQLNFSVKCGWMGFLCLGFSIVNRVISKLLFHWAFAKEIL